MRRSHKFLRNVSYSFIAKIWGILLLFFTTPFIVKTMGDESYGLMNVLVAFAGYFTLVDFGFSNALTKYIAEYHARKENDSVANIIQVGFLFYSIVAVLGGLFILIGFQFYFKTVDVSPSLQNDVRICVYLISMAFLFSILGTFFSAIIRGYQRFDLLVIRTIGLATLDRGAIVLVLFLGYGIVSVIAVTLSINILTFILFYFVIRNKFPEISLFPSWNRERFLQLFHFSKWKFIGGVSVNFLQNMPNVIIASLVGVGQVTYFIVPRMLAKKVGREICSTLNRVIYPFMSESVSIDTEDQKKDMYFRSVKWLFSIMAPSAVFLFVLGDKVLTYWINIDMGLKASFILRTFAILYWFTSITHFGVSIFEAHDNTRFPNLNSLLVFIVAIAGYFVFIPIWGINGIPIAHICSLPVVIYFQHRVLKLVNSDWKEFFRMSIRKTLMASILMGIAVYLFRFFASNLSRLILLVPIVAILQFSLFYIIKVLDDIDYEILRSFMRNAKLSLLGYKSIVIAKKFKA